MMNQNQHSFSVIGVPITPLDSYPADVTLAGEPELCGDCKRDKKDSKDNWIVKFCMVAKYHIHGIKEYARLLSMSRTERVFRKVFSVTAREKLLKSSQCYLSTTIGPIAGMLYVSTKKIAFISDRSLQSSLNGDVTKFRYKVVIPLTRLQSVIPIENLEVPNEKYVKIVTVDGFDFWFMRIGKNQQVLQQLGEINNLRSSERFLNNGSMYIDSQSICVNGSEGREIRVQLFLL